MTKATRLHNSLLRHPMLGQEVKHVMGRIRCSRCHEPIPVDTVPPMLFGPEKGPRRVATVRCGSTMIPARPLLRGGCLRDTANAKSEVCARTAEWAHRHLDPAGTSYPHGLGQPPLFGVGQPRLPRAGRPQPV